MDRIVTSVRMRVIQRMTANVVNKRAKRLIKIDGADDARAPPWWASVPLLLVLVPLPFEDLRAKGSGTPLY